jgi:hypothetical protein
MAAFRDGVKAFSESNPDALRISSDALPFTGSNWHGSAMEPRPRPLVAIGLLSKGAADID